jgi:primosomal protein N'
MDVLESVRVQALLDVMEGDFPYHYRRICRWYSKTFHTPLVEVDDLPMDYVLQAFFEDRFEDMSKSDRRKLALEMTETEAEKKKRLAKEKASSDDAFAKRIAKKARKDEAEAAAKKKLADEAARAKVEAMANKEMAGAPKIPDLPGFSMKFDSGGNLLPDDGEESFAPPPRK